MLRRRRRSRCSTTHSSSKPGISSPSLAIASSGRPCSTRASIRAGVELDLRAGTNAHDVPVEDEGQIGFVTQGLAQ